MKRVTEYLMNRSPRNHLAALVLPVLVLAAATGVRAQNGPPPLLLRSSADLNYAQAKDIQQNGGDSTQNFRDAIDYYLQYLAADTSIAFADTVSIYEKMADSYYQLEEWDNALTYYQWLIDRDPDQSYLSGYLLFAGYAVWQTKGPESALPYYARYVELEPTDLPQRLALAGMYLNASDWEKAADHYLVALEADPANQDVVNTLNNLRLRLRHRYEPITLALVEFQPANPKYLLDLGQFHYEAGNLAKTIEFDRRYLQAKPDDIAAWELIGDAYKRTGDIAQAMNAYRQILRLDAGNIRAYCELTAIYVDQGNIDQAITEAKRALAIDPENAQANYVMGEAGVKWGMRKLEADHPGRELTKMPFNFKELFKSIATNYFEKARKDPRWRNFAIEQINYLTQFYPNPEDRFMAPPAERVPIVFPPPAV
jgi:tetratricopeptide (TPR) repeat protein